VKYTVKLYGRASVTAYAEVEASNPAEAVRIVHEEPELIGDVEWKYEGLEEIFESLSEAWPTRPAA